MGIQLAVSTRNARLEAIETEIGASPILKIVTGTVPTDCAMADPGTVLASMTLPPSWMADAGVTVGGRKDKSGTWQDLSADTNGTAGHFRIYESTGTTCKIQGTCALTSGGDMNLDNLTFTTGDLVTVISFSLTDGNA
jgi:hypothetical protein